MLGNALEVPVALGQGDLYSWTTGIMQGRAAVVWYAPVRS